MCCRLTGAPFLRGLYGLYGGEKEERQLGTRLMASRALSYSPRGKKAALSGNRGFWYPVVAPDLGILVSAMSSAHLGPYEV